MGKKKRVIEKTVHAYTSRSLIQTPAHIYHIPRAPQITWDRNRGAINPHGRRGDTVYFARPEQMSDVPAFPQGGGGAGRGRYVRPVHSAYVLSKEQFFGTSIR